MSDPIETLLDLASKIEDWPQDVSGRDAVKTIRAATEALEVQLGETNEALAACQSEGQGWKRKAEELQARLADYEDAHRVTVEDCGAPDEQHCSCVPSLRLEMKRLQARLAEALKTLDAIDEEGDDHYYDIADAARMILRGIVTHGDCSEPTVNRTADSADAAQEK